MVSQIKIYMGRKISYICFFSISLGRFKKRLRTTALRKPSLGRPVTLPEFYRPKMCRKWTTLNRYISVITDSDEKLFAIFERTLTSFLFFMFVCPNLRTVFLVLFLFLTFFSFSIFSRYTLLNRLTHCIQNLNDWRHQGGLMCDRNWGCQVRGIPLNRVLQNFELLNR